ncbi:DUF3263 domain-containing protein [Microcella alkalica]|uniref:DUF3263 domain-containing protein n=1 Tax=Microcella alkalica TaxID=355930 RepID=A0A839ECX4_9MICO|nr:DUF3263 domain-containing protein [Microcella alkalica]MBA8848835.1 hypothetical protein [Microcella alkalica]MBA8849056.1 hypothetical protein [Microcella alkalica]
MTTQLNEVAREMLEFETRAWPSPHRKERAIRARFSISPVRYYQRLWALIDGVRVEQFDPMVVHRLRRMRDCGSVSRVHASS